MIQAMFHSHQWVQHPPPLWLADRKYAIIQRRKIQVTGVEVVQRAVPRLSYLDLRVYLLPRKSWSHMRGPANCPYLDELPTCISPRCIISLSSHDAFSFNQDPPHPLIHILFPALNAGRCGVMNWDAKNGNGRKSGVIFVGSSLDCCAT